MKRLAGMGALIAVSDLPTWAEDDPTVFPNRGQYERLSLSYAVVEIGLGNPFSILHISDSHLTAAYDHENEKKHKLSEARTTTFGGRQEEALRDALAWAKQHVDYVLHTGDLIDWQSEANFDLVRKYFGDKMFGTLGNHEFSPDMWLSDPKEEKSEKYKDLTRKKLQEVYPFDVRFQSQTINGVNFITIDDVYGYVTEEQVKRFRLEVEKQLPIVLCMHVPIYTENMLRANRRFWSDKGPLNYNESPKKRKLDPLTNDFIEYLRHEPLLRCILAGHMHITIEDQFSPTCREYVVGGGFLFHGREVLFV